MSNSKHSAQEDQNLIISVFKQMPGLIVLMDLESKFLLSNNYTAHKFGYKNETNMLGIKPHDMRCRAVESADLFVEQNNQVTISKKTLTILDIHEYADNHVSLLLTKKTPFFTSAGEIAGTICHCTEVKSNLFLRIANEIAFSDSQIRENNSLNERSYMIRKTYNELSQRESECIFYIIRGFTAKQTAQRLKLSPKTVEAYIEKIKLKLNCHKKSEMIEMAIQLGYLNVIPTSFLSGELSLVID